MAAKLSCTFSEKVHMKIIIASIPTWFIYYSGLGQVSRAYYRAAPDQNFVRCNIKENTEKKVEYGDN